MQNIDIGDTLHHLPSGECWIVARVTEKHVYPAGWPPCRGDIGDCVLLEKATASQKNDMILHCKKLPSGDERRVT